MRIPLGDHSTATQDRAPAALQEYGHGQGREHRPHGPRGTSLPTPLPLHPSLPQVCLARPGSFTSIPYSRSDLWAAGSLAYQIYGGLNPFLGGLASRSYTVDQLPALPPGTPVLVQELVRALLHRWREILLPPAPASYIYPTHTSYTYLLHIHPTHTSYVCLLRPPPSPTPYTLFRDPSSRPSPRLAATVCQLLLWAPRFLIDFFSCPEQLLKSSCPSVRPSVRPSVGRSVGLSTFVKK